MKAKIFGHLSFVSLKHSTKQSKRDFHLPINRSCFFALEVFTLAQIAFSSGGILLASAFPMSTRKLPFWVRNRTARNGFLLFVTVSILNLFLSSPCSVLTMSWYVTLSSFPWTSLTNHWFILKSLFLVTFPSPVVPCFSFLAVAILLFCLSLDMV